MISRTKSRQSKPASAMVKWSYDETSYFAYGDEYYDEVKAVFSKRMKDIESESDVIRELFDLGYRIGQN